MTSQHLMQKIYQCGIQKQRKRKYQCNTSCLMGPRMEIHNDIIKNENIYNMKNAKTDLSKKREYVQQKICKK